ncbi:IS3 family transposase [Fusobacteria bacterium ZRK30]|nr:IS3 family transposase [Fusobacteria bacterium ZRK30]
MLCSIDENPFKITNIEKYQIIDSLKKVYTIEKLASLLNITSRAYRKWISKGKPIANNFNDDHAELILVEHLNNFEVYGTLRLKYHLLKKLNVNFNHKKILRYKNILNLKTITRKKKSISRRIQVKRNKSYMAENLLNCNFKAEKPRSKYSTDVSYINCSDGRLYLSAIKDLYSKQIISYDLSNKNDTDLIINTLKGVNLRGSILHSDQGSLYHSWSYRNHLEKNECLRSMSRPGACWENSPIENWFSQLKEEQLRRIGKQSKSETRKSRKKYVQWYNTERIQKDLNYQSPIQFLNSN